MEKGAGWGRRSVIFQPADFQLVVHVVFDGHELAGLKPVLRRYGDGHVAHGSSEVDFYAWMHHETMCIAACNDHHVDTEGPDVGFVDPSGEVLAQMKLSKG